MNTILKNLNWIAAAIVMSVASPVGVLADEAELDVLFERLQQDVLPEWEDVQNQIWAIWSKSGSDAMDLLLQRGRDALEGGDPVAAIEHFSALIDHAPEFAEGYNARATAYFHSEMYGLSLNDIERTLALNPRHFGAMLGLGSILSAIGKEDQALEAYRAALALNPHREDIQEAVSILSVRHGGVDL